MNVRNRLAQSCAWLGLLAAALGCSGAEDAARLSESPQASDARPLPDPGQPVESRLGMQSASGPTMTGDVADLAESLEYAVPEGWDEIAPQPFRRPNFQIGPEPVIEAYVTVLPGTGGGVEANLNRWRSQMGLAPLEDDQMAQVPRREVLGAEAYVVDFEGAFRGMGANAIPGQRMLGALLDAEGRAVFVKLVGPAERVAAQRETFNGFLESLAWREGMSGSAPVAAPVVAAPEAPAGSRLGYITPEGWREAEPRPMRLVNFTVGEASECYVTILTGMGGGLAANVNRWRAQMGQPPLDDAGIEALERLDAVGTQGWLVDVEGNFSGMGDQATLEGQRLLGLVAELGPRTLFVKMTGPAEEVAEQRHRFIAFCESLEIE